MPHNLRHEPLLYYQDPRWNSWRWKPILDKWGHLRVFINPDITKTATFLIENNEPVSTVFFVLMKWDMAVYAVTTRHSIFDSDVQIRLNLKRGGKEDKPILKGDWFCDPSSDVAVVPLEFMWKGEFEKFDIELIDHTELRSYADHYYPMNQFPADHPSPLRYGSGDEVFSIGLFDHHSGSDHAATPVARFGHIALVPAIGEKITAEIEPDIYQEIEAFLVEIASWGGQSGSPVFLRPTKVYEERTSSRPSWEVSHCIGIIQGFYPGEQDVKINGHDATLSPLNMGIALVIPAKKITELLHRPDVKAQREQSKLEKIRRKANPSAAHSDPLNKFFPRH